MPNPLAGCTVLAIDPGPETSGWVWFVEGQLTGLNSGYMNDVIIDYVSRASHSTRRHPVVVESVECYGMAVGKSVFQTCYTIGRIMQVAGDRFVPMTRREVKLHLCNSARAKDTNIKQALLDRWGGKDVALGNKKNPGPLYGVKSHAWSALALAVVWAETTLELVDGECRITSKGKTE